MFFTEDENFARQLQHEYQAYENFRHLKEGIEKENSNPVDSKLEYIDPTPSIHDLFMKFNRNFFWNTLGMVEVVWSSRMTKCAGLCSFEGGRGLCKIALSAPLLSLRPRKDLVETLLHEMIHAYLFVTHNYKDREDHGPEFHKHMFRINKEAGTKITVYHTFFDEVEYYQRHIWRCDGPCQKKKPYFGFVRRAINRAPGPNDTWWSQHQSECGGTFTKISEPEKKPKKRKGIIVEKPKKNKDIRNYFSHKGTSQVNIENSNKSNIKTLSDLKGNAMNGVKTNTGTGTIVLTNTKTGNSKTKNSSKGSTKTNNKNVNGKNLVKTKISETNKINFPPCKLGEEKAESSGTNDIREFVRNKWANKFINSKPDKPSSKKIKLQHSAGSESSADPVEKSFETSREKDRISEAETSTSSVSDEYKKCPVCSERILQSEMNLHLESCLQCTFVNEGDWQTDEDIVCESVPCPCCYKWFPERQMNSHIDECLTMITLKEELLAS